LDEIPHGPPLPNLRRHGQSGSELCRRLCRPSPASRLLKLPDAFIAATLNPQLSNHQPSWYARYGLVRVAVRVPHQYHPMITGLGTMVRLQPPLGPPPAVKPLPALHSLRRRVANFVGHLSPRLGARTSKGS
jgi:hypothetical protein